jgi:hypothetical protein
MHFEVLVQSIVSTSQAVKNLAQGALGDSYSPQVISL